MIYYFTGTGNSRYVARLVSNALKEKYKKMSILERTSIEHTDDTLVFVCPTYAWRIPRIVEEWILNTEFNNAKEAYFIMTCGENIGNAGHYNELLCKKKDLSYKGTYPIIMPENYLALFDTPEDDEAQHIIQKALPSIDQVIKHIEKKEPFPSMSLHLKDKMLSSVVNTVFYPIYVKADPFYTTDCKGCGLCEKLCPLNNIHLENNHPVWGDHCTHCMACIAQCPFKAIEYGKASKERNRYYIE